MDPCFVSVLTKKDDTLAPNVAIVRHQNRIFVGWVIEVEQ
jgi:hypothetical protein